MNRLTWLVMQREVLESLRKKFIWVSLAVVLLGSLAVVILPEVLPNDQTKRDLVTVGDVPTELTDSLLAGADSIDLSLTIQRAEEIAEPGDDALAIATDRVKEGDADLALVWGAGPDAAPRILQRTDAADISVAYLQQALRTYQARQVFDAAGVGPDVLARVDAIPATEVQVVDTARSGRQAAAFALTVVMYLVIILLASTVANSVAAEKANRVSEVLLAVVPSRSLLYGKVLGVSVIGLGIVVAGAIPIATKAIFGGNLPESLGTTMLSSGVWLVGGIALYLLVAAVLGALVDRTEEVGGAIAPLSMGLVAVYLVTLGSVESSLGAVLSVIPLSSPIAMPARIAIGAASWWQIGLSLALLPVSVVLVARLAASMYARAIVRTGRRLKLSEVLH